MTEQTKKEKELFWSQIFIIRINCFMGGSDFYLRHREEGAVDVRGISRSGTYQDLNMQLTWIKDFEFDPKKKQTQYLSFSKNTIIEAITRKTKKYSDVKNVILLLQGYMSKGWARDILDKEFCEQYQGNQFNGIYYLSRPALDSKWEERPENGLVFTIKPVVIQYRDINIKVVL